MYCVRVGDEPPNTPGRLDASNASYIAASAIAKRREGGATKERVAVWYDDEQVLVYEPADNAITINRNVRAPLADIRDIAVNALSWVLLLHPGPIRLEVK